jgi:hypothetical protein
MIAFFVLLVLLNCTHGLINSANSLLRSKVEHRVPSNGHCVGRSFRWTAPLNLVPRGDQSPRSTSFLLNFGVVFVFLPLSAELFPFLLSKVTDFSVEPLERQRYILELLLLKRVFLYSTAIAGVDWMAKRSLSDGTVGLGQRLAGLNEEMLDFSSFGEEEEGGLSEGPGNLGRDFNEQAAPLIAELDDMEGQQKALALPILVALSLLASFAGLQVSQQITTWLQAQTTLSEATRQQVLDSAIIQALSQFLSALATVGVCTVFSKAEIKKLLEDTVSSSERAFGRPLMINNIGGNATLIAVACSLIAVINPPITQLLPPSAYWRGNGLWPIGNAVNLLVGVTISRAFQLPSLPIVLTALSALVAYDVIFVLGTQALTDGGQSIMEAVAMAKLQASSSAVSDAASAVAASASGASTDAGVILSTPAPAPAPAAPVEWVSKAMGTFWRPGLLQVNLNGKVSDALGLGDVIFPSLLAGWALRYDNRAKEYTGEGEGSGGGGGSSIYSSALGGYALGCLLCELFQTGAGQPALLYVVPAMVGVMAATNIDLILDEGTRKELLDFEG